MPNVARSVGTCTAAADCHAEARAKRPFSLGRVPASNKLVQGLHIEGTRWRGLLLFLANSPSLRVTAAPRRVPAESDRFAWWVHPGALGSRTSGCGQILDKEGLAYTATRVSGPWLVAGIEWFHPLLGGCVDSTDSRTDRWTKPSEFRSGFTLSRSEDPFIIYVRAGLSRSSAIGWGTLGRSVGDKIAKRATTFVCRRKACRGHPILRILPSFPTWEGTVMLPIGAPNQ